MSRLANIWSISRSRILQHREETRNGVRDASIAIERSQAPLSNDVVERPFMIPLGHDPYDIWHIILHSIADPAEILKLSEVCPMFREILGCKRKCIQTRLPEIVHLILHKRPRYLLEPEDLDTHWRYRVPRRYISPSKEIILNLRLISRGCKNSAEVILESMDSGSGKLFLKIKTKERAYSIIDGIMGKEINVDSFFPPNLEVTRSPSLNPMQEYKKFSEAISVLLELTGERFRTFSYVATESPRCFYDKLMEWVMYMPNLESLELFRRGYLIIRERGDIQNFPVFPPCPHLRSLTILYPRFLGSAVQRIMESSPFLRTLDVQHVGNVGMEDLIPTLEMIPILPHLESLHVPLYASLLQDLQFHIHLPLRKIVLQRHCSSGETTSTKLFPFLNQFKNTLEHLELGLEVQKAGHRDFLDLPNLKFFKWRYNESFKNMQFLLYAERLEVVHMMILERIDDADEFLERFLVKVAIGFDGVDLWKVFPRMRRFRTYWRGEYREICRP